MPCREDKKRICGAGWRNSLFKLVKKAPDAKQFHNADGAVQQEVTGERHSSHRMGLSYLGCFKDAGTRDMTMVNGNASPEQCFK